MAVPESKMDLSKRLQNRRKRVLFAIQARQLETQSRGIMARDMFATWPYKRPPAGTRQIRRSNGLVNVALTACEDEDGKFWGLPYGQDRLIVDWAASLFAQQGYPADDFVCFGWAADILRVIHGPDWNDSGRTFAELRARLSRVACCFFQVGEHQGPRTGLARRGEGKTARAERRKLIYHANYHVIEKMHVWIEPKDRGDSWFRLGRGFADALRESRRAPIDWETLRALREHCIALDVYKWLAYRSWRLSTAGEAPKRIPLFGPIGLFAELQIPCNSRRHALRRFREAWSKVLEVWPECPSNIDGDAIILCPALAIRGSTRINLPGPRKSSVSRRTESINELRAKLLRIGCGPQD